MSDNKKITHPKTAMEAAWSRAVQRYATMPKRVQPGPAQPKKDEQK